MDSDDATTPKKRSRASSLCGDYGPPDSPGGGEDSGADEAGSPSRAFCYGLRPQHRELARAMQGFADAARGATRMARSSDAGCEEGEEGEECAGSDMLDEEEPWQRAATEAEREELIARLCRL